MDGGLHRSSVAVRDHHVFTHQGVDVKDHVAPVMVGQFHDARVHADGVLGAGFHAKTAKHALGHVDVEADRVFFDGRVGVVASHHEDAVRRADGGAEHAGHAFGGAVFPFGQAVPGARTVGRGPPHL